MKYYLLLSFSFLFFSSANAQELDWAVQNGGSSGEYGRSVATDGSGNVYITGFFAGTADFDPGPGVQNLTSAGGNDIFIQKLDPTGNLVWVRQLGGSGNEYSYTIDLDDSANVYIAGRFDGTVDFDPGNGTQNRTSAGSADMFVLKLDNAGNFGYASTMGGTAVDQINGISVDELGYVYAAGVFNGTADLDPGTGSVQHTSAGGEDLFVLKLTPTGDLFYSISLGSTANDRAYDITADNFGNTYITGVFNGTVDFDYSTATANLTSAGQFDAYVLKLDANGNYEWAHNMGGSSYDFGYGIATDPDGNVITTGYFQSANADFDPGSGMTNLSTNGNYDIFLQKMDAQGNFKWARSMGGTEDDRGYAVAADNDGNIYLTGYFISIMDFDPDTSTHTMIPAGAADFYVEKLDSNGYMHWAVSMGGGNHDFGLDIALDDWNNIFVTGNFEGTADFDPSAGTLNLTPGGGSDVFAMKLKQCLVTQQLTVNACDTYTSPSGNFTWTTTGVYTDTLPNSNSCDSIVIVNLTVNTSASTARSFQICGGDSMLLEGVYQTLSGTYYDTLSTATGCDSVLITALTVTQVDTSVTVSTNGSSISANLAGATYRWIDCATGLAVPGATSSTFQPAANGLYALEITDDSCTARSACYSLVSIGVEEIKTALKITLYPNPVEDVLNIAIEQSPVEGSVEIIDLQGKILKARSFTGEKTISVDVSDLAAGVYFLSIKTTEGRLEQKFVKVE